MNTQNLTPQRHEDGKEDSGGVIEEVRGFGGATGSAEVPVVACFVTQRTHGEIETLVTHLQTEEGREKKVKARVLTIIACVNADL